MTKSIILLLFPLLAFGQNFSSQEIAKLKQKASNVKITRDTWGVAHIEGNTDADAVFGMLYAQCEDDFDRVERNYINALGRSAEVGGVDLIYNDLRMRLFQDSLSAIQNFNSSPEWLKKLCYAFADGVNFYLITSNVKPKLLTKFYPWMPFLFSEGSIGGDIESISLDGLRNFYGHNKQIQKKKPHKIRQEPEPKGSNGFAIAPSKSESGNALLLINPHTTFFFRSELQVISKEGLNAYGATTWGQFFVYQGFNEHCGWMHTSSKADVIDEYMEKIVVNRNQEFYKYGDSLKKIIKKDIVILFKSKEGQLIPKKFVGYYTHHGPITSGQGENWISTKLMNEPVNALTQSYMRTKAKTFKEFQEVMEYKTNSSNNTVYADDAGNIAYWHGNFMPIRDPKFDWSNPVDGSNPETEWKGLHQVKDIVHCFNPDGGWIQNCNSSPFSVAGKYSPKKQDYPGYMAPDDENARSMHALQLLEVNRKLSLESLIEIAYDSYLPGFALIIPSLIKAYDELSVLSQDKLTLTKCEEPIRLLKEWKFRFSNSSVELTLATFWAKHIRKNISKPITDDLDQLSIIDYMKTETSPVEKIKSLSDAIDELERDFGTWRTSWGEVNRFQRIIQNGELVYDDNQPSIPVPFTSSFWGSLAAFGSKSFPNTKKMYGYVGNSFVAVVEFGKKITAKSSVTGGASSNPKSKHFDDQATDYSNGKFKDVWFYKSDYSQHAEKTYSPGE